jgi:SAM-dependent methyltransferase
MAWWFAVVEARHELQNPTSAEKIRLLGDYLRLTAESRVLDIACGKAGPALVLAEAYGCSIVGVERSPGFAGEARRRVAEHGLEDRVEIRTGDARELALEPGAWDAALCLGASFVWGTMAEAAEALAPGVRPGGFVAIGEPYWQRWPLLDGVDDQGYVPLEETVARLERAGLALTGLIGASEDDWDRYESLHWRAIEEWLAEQPDDEFRAQHAGYRRGYLRNERELLGWAIFVGRKP